MKIEVRSEKISYIFNCDKVIDGNREAKNTIDNCEKLVILRKIKRNENAEITSKDIPYETISVFNAWTFWRIIENNDVIGYYQTLSGRIPLTQKMLDKNTEMMKDEKCFIGPNHVAELEKYNRVCLHCGRKFETNNNENRFCSTCTHANGR